MAAWRKGFMARIGHGWPLLGALALLGGCISIGGKPPQHLIGLSAENVPPAGAMPGGRVTEALLVLDPAADRKIDVTRVAVQVDEAQIAYLKDAAWVERPARLFRRLLAETIRAKGRRLVLEGSDEDTGAKTTLAGRLIECGYDARSRSVVVRYDALLDAGDGTVRAQRFEAVEQGVLPETASVAPALNRAANRVAAQVADWVAQP